MAVNARDKEVQCDMEIEMELNNDLLDCAALGDLDRLKQLLTQFGASVNTRDSFGQGVLHMAVKNKRLPCLKYLLEYMTTNGLCEAEDSEISPLETTNDFGQTPLIVAAMNNSTSCLDTLLGYGAEVNATDNMGRTALHLAAMHGHPVCVEILLNCRANLDMVDR
jgi:ankyrin repeat protein